MKILKAKVHWYGPNVLNAPDLQVLVDKIPEWGPRIYERKGRIGQFYFFSEVEGYVVYFVWSGKGNDGGYGGAVWRIKARVKGKIRRITVKGAWSSRCSVMNQMGFPHSMETEITDDPESFERGDTFFAGALTIERAKEAVALVETQLGEKVELVKEVRANKFSKGEIRYYLKRVR